MITTTSREDLKSLTGLQRPNAIKRFLTRQRIPYIVGADGWPRVLQSAIFERMGGPIIPPTHGEPQLRLRNNV
jgi:hypothetical protein